MISLRRGGHKDWIWKFFEDDAADDGGDWFRSPPVRSNGAANNSKWHRRLVKRWAQWEWMMMIMVIMIMIMMTLSSSPCYLDLLLILYLLWFSICQTRPKWRQIPRRQCCQKPPLDGVELGSANRSVKEERVIAHLIICNVKLILVTSCFWQYFNQWDRVDIFLQIVCITCADIW